MRFLKGFFVGIILIGLMSLSGVSQNQLDLSFNAAPSVKPVSSNKGQVIQPDGKVIVWGGNLNADAAIKGQIARLNTDGTVDPTFNYCACHFKQIGNVALQADGKMIVSDFSSAFFTSRIGIRLNSDGSVDGAYNPVFASDVISAKVITVQPDGKILYEENYLLNNHRRISRYNSDGSIDGSFSKIIFDNGGQLSSFGDLKIAPDGKIYFGYRNGGGNVAILQRYNSDGTVDGAWAQAGYIGTGPIVSSIDLQPDGKVLAGGSFTSVNGFTTSYFVRFLTTGAVDTTFTASGFTSSGTIRLLSTGKFLVSGRRTGDTGAKIYRLNSDGSLDSSLADAKSSSPVKDGFELTSLKPDHSEDVEFASNVLVLTRFVLDSSERPVFFGSSASNQQFYRLDASGNVDAGFTANANDFAKVHHIGLRSDGKMLITGGYDLMGGVGRSGISVLNADGTVDTGFNPGTGSPWNTLSPGRVLVQPDGKFIVDGITSYNGVTTTGLVRINTDGTRDTSFSAAVDSIEAMALQADGKIVIGGRFPTVNGVSRKQIARLNSDGTLDTAFNPILGQPISGAIVIFGLAVQPDGKIMIGGHFANVNGFLRTNIARLNTDGSLDASFDVGTTGPGAVLNTVNGVYLQSDGKVLTNTGVNLERRNSDGSIDPSFLPKAVGKINALAVRANGDIFIGGQFEAIDGVRCKNFAWLNSAGLMENRSFLIGANDETNSSSVEVTSIVAQADGKVLIGGNFTRFQGVARPGIARVSAATFLRTSPYDFDGDGRSDISVFRPSDGNWYLAQSTAGFAVNHFGQNGDAVTPSDYDGDGKTDMAIFRDGVWWYLNSSNSTVGLVFLGAAGDIPLRADFDGDSKDDFVCFRPSTVQWFINFSSYPSSGYPSGIVYQFGGGVGDIPFTHYFGGNGKAGIGIFRPSEGKWYWATDAPNNFVAFQWGMNGDVPVPADYDGDGRTDYAVWRPSNGAWYILNSRDQSISIMTWGMAGDKPVVGDYDGDGKSDIAVYRPSNGVWFIMQSTAGFTGMQYGLSTDKPIPNAYIP